MSQIKIYGRKSHIEQHRQVLSDTIHACVVEALAYPPDKRFHRFIPLEPENFIYPADRSERYTIIEISMFEGRSAEAKKVARSCVRGLRRVCQEVVLKKGAATL